jgi:hypothetical protein
VAKDGTLAIALRQKRWSGRERYGFSDKGGAGLLAGRTPFRPNGAI